MNIRMWASALACVCGLAMPLANAQTTQSLDYIVALVNSEPITHQELEREIKRVAQQIEQQGQIKPPSSELRRLVLERLINDRAQLQLARETGIRIDTSAIDQAEREIATQNQVDVEGLHQRLAKDGVSVASFRDGLRDQLALSRLHERSVETTIRVSDVDVERAMQARQTSNVDPLTFDINLAQILVAVPEKATAEQAAALFIQAKGLLARIRAGEDFERLVKEFSAADRNNGGQLGVRRADRYPALFVEATQTLNVGDVSEIVRSGAGFHILKVIEKRAPARLVLTVVQSRARHILLRSSPQQSQAQAIAKLADARQRIVGGKTDFASLAKSLSQDTSAERGGDLGWANPGMFVPEFEVVMNSLKEGEISQPLVSRFGVHLIQLMERRRMELSPQEVRESVRSELRRSRYEEAYRNWAQDVRGRAFVEMREPPQ